MSLVFCFSGTEGDENRGVGTSSFHPYTGVGTYSHLRVGFRFEITAKKKISEDDGAVR